MKYTNKSQLAASARRKGKSSKEPSHRLATRARSAHADNEAAGSDPLAQRSI